MKVCDRYRPEIMGNVSARNVLCNERAPGEGVPGSSELGRIVGVSENGGESVLRPLLRMLERQQEGCAEDNIGSEFRFVFGRNHERGQARRTR